MNHLISLLLMLALLPSAYGQAANSNSNANANSTATQRNPIADPFGAAIPKAEVPVRAVTKPAPSALPSAAAAPVRVNLPAGLHAILIRENGMGLLSTGEPGAQSIAVISGRDVRLQDQDYRVEISQSSIKLWSAQSGRAVWEGGLAGNAQPSVPVDLSQIKYIPPLSAGVDPGLGGSSYSSRGSASPINKVSEAR